ncbi:hypothetical protein MNBD_NITROSPINAE03-1615 [hydrothermal vent metagenome]|uniref:6-hydroxymethylpterin diphosphokinase MptE-like domain-containing protein n=1 Tax=hydrothermal vent metagenome TaxID=652676 RepID=A0A3B1CK51_9ZZZZ
MTTAKNNKLKSLSARFPLIHDVVTFAPDLVQIETARSGAKTGRLGNTRLCSLYDPVGEAIKFTASLKIKPGDHVALYGIGLGYHLKPLLDAVGDDGQVVAAEANASLLKAAISVLDERALLDDRLTLVCGRDEEALLSDWSRAFAAMDPDRTKVAIHIPSFQLIPEDFPKTKNAVEMIRMERRFPLVMGGYQTDNFRKNLPVVLQSSGIATLAGAIKGGVAAVVGAGPSLDKQIPLLSQFRYSAVLCSDTAAPALIKRSIIPDMIFSVDPQKETKLHFDMMGKLDIPLALVPTANCDVVSQWPGPLYFGFIDPDRFSGPAQAFARRMGALKSGGSVSCFALETALMMEAKTVILFGQDFCFDGDKSYASDTVPAMLGGHQYDDEIVLERDYFGREVKTSRSLYGYRREFENLTKSCRASVYTLSPEGVCLSGIEPIPSPLPYMSAVANSCCLADIKNRPKQKAGGEVARSFLDWIDRI